jgi:hypothetical protein
VIKHGFDLGPIAPTIIGFILSFYVVGRYWLAHHALFETVRSYDRLLMAVNLAFLAGIAYLPFPTTLIILAPMGRGLATFYTGSVAVVGLLLVVLVAAARRPALLRGGESAGGTVRLALAALGSPLVFSAAALTSMIDPRRGLFVLLLLPPVGFICDRLGRTLGRWLDARRAPIAPSEPPLPERREG